MEMILLLLLMTSYRIVVELVYASPSPEFLSACRPFWGVALSIAVYFVLRDVVIIMSFCSTAEKLVLRWLRGFGNVVGLVATASVIAVLGVLYVDGTVDGRNYVGIVSGLRETDPPSVKLALLLCVFVLFPANKSAPVLFATPPQFGGSSSCTRRG